MSKQNFLPFHLPVSVLEMLLSLPTFQAETTNSGLSNSAIGELRAEITSVKGLLLST